MYLCLRGIEVPVPSQESKQACIYVLRGIEVPVPSQESKQSCIYVLEVVIEVPVPSQESNKYITTYFPGLAWYRHFNTSNT
jgi:hypothetical protein